VLGDINRTIKISINYLANIPEGHGFYWFMIIAIGFFTLIDYVFFWFTGYELFPPGLRV
jgi:hypothetical protein